jgi:hypothetical protein
VPSAWVAGDAAKVDAHADAGVTIPGKWMSHCSDSWHHFPLAATVAPNQTPPTISAPTPAPASK